MPPELAEAVVSGESRLVETGDGEVFLHVLTPPVRVVIAGATQIGQVLSDLAKRIGYIGYDVVIVDPRSAFRNARAFRLPSYPSTTNL